ncbi:hypothetical protein D3C75_848940 [compost metagenome]
MKKRNHFLRGKHLYMKMDVRHLFPKLPKDIRQCACGGHRQFECAMFQAGQVHKLLLPLFQFKQSPFRPVQEFASELIQPQISPCSIKKRDPQVLFQALNRFAQRGLGNVQTSCSFSHMFQTGYRDKILQLKKFHFPHPFHSFESMKS